MTQLQHPRAFVTSHSNLDDQSKVSEVDAAPNMTETDREVASPVLFLFTPHNCVSELKKSYPICWEALAVHVAPGDGSRLRWKCLKTFGN